jgi:hypothetical protein
VKLEIVLLHPGQLGRDRDPVAASIDVHSREAASCRKPTRGLAITHIFDQP